MSVTGDVGNCVGPEVMGIDWMTGEELSQAIPPAYTQWIGEHLLRAGGQYPREEYTEIPCRTTSFLSFH